MLSTEALGVDGFIILGLIQYLIKSTLSDAQQKKYKCSKLRVKDDRQLHKPARVILKVGVQYTRGTYVSIDNLYFKMMSIKAT